MELITRTNGPAIAGLLLLAAKGDNMEIKILNAIVKTAEPICCQEVLAMSSYAFEEISKAGEIVSATFGPDGEFSFCWTLQIAVVEKYAAMVQEEITQILYSVLNQDAVDVSGRPAYEISWIE